MQLTNLQSWQPGGRRGGCCYDVSFPFHLGCSRGMCLSVFVSCKELTMYVERLKGRKVLGKPGLFL